LKPAVIHKRRVHYLPGFDPRGARFYHQLYSREASLQSVLNRLHPKVGPRIKLTPHFSSWSVQSSSPFGVVSTDYQFMGWDDLVRLHWPANTAPLLAQCLPMYSDYLRSGSIFKVRKISNTALLTGLFPAGYLALLGLGSSALFFGAQHCVGSLTDSHLAGTAAGLALCASLGPPALKHANRIGILWLLRTFGFIHRWGSGQIPELEHRVNAMAEHILRCHLQDPAQETLLIGHSVGCLLSVCVAARLLELSASLHPSPSLANMHLLTLGQCIPLISLLPQAESFRANLSSLGNQNRLSWTDVSAKADPLCFFRSSPLQPSDSLQPSLKTARFFRMFPPRTYQKMRWDKIRLHFQYLMASELPAAYDFFAITAGPAPLETHLQEEE
jgi:hypothetical protein